jgi:anti-sigma regulatory factor (Ser/Thr protein kinase)
VGTGTTAGHRGHVHEAAFYDTDDGLLSVAVPFLEQGVKAGEPTLVALGEETGKLVRRAIEDLTGIQFLEDRNRHTRPASVIHSSREILAGHVAGGAQRIRYLGETPHPGHGARWGWWARYEATINHAFTDFPLWKLCPYDVRIAPADVLDDAARTHPHIATMDGAHQVNPQYQDPAEFIAQRLPGDGDPLETTPPLTELIDPTPNAARRAARAAGDGVLSSTAEIDDLVMAVSEVVTNAVMHGRPPVVLRVWTAPDRVVATVGDRGPGPIDPFVGLLPTTDTRTAGMGLWLAHQLCSHVELDRAADGFTVRLVAERSGTGRTGHARDGS